MNFGFNFFECNINNTFKKKNNFLKNFVVTGYLFIIL